MTVKYISKVLQLPPQTTASAHQRQPGGHGAGGGDDADAGAAAAAAVAARGRPPPPVLTLRLTLECLDPMPHWRQLAKRQATRGSGGAGSDSDDDDDDDGGDSDADDDDDATAAAAAAAAVSAGPLTCTVEYPVLQLDSSDYVVPLKLYDKGIADWSTLAPRDGFVMTWDGQPYRCVCCACWSSWPVCRAHRSSQPADAAL